MSCIIKRSKELTGQKTGLNGDLSSNMMDRPAKSMQTSSSPREAFYRPGRGLASQVYIASMDSLSTVLGGTIVMIMQTSELA